MSKKKSLIWLILTLITMNNFGQGLSWYGISPGTAYHRSAHAFEDGSILYIGSFQTSFDAAPNAEIFNLTGTGTNYRGFLQHLDSLGNLLNAAAWTGNGTLNLQTLDTDPFGNIIVGGHFTGTIDFDPGPGTMNMSSMGGFDLILMKLTSSFELIWAKTIGSALDQRCDNVACDLSGNLVLSGEYSGTVDFDPGPGVYSQSAASFGESMYVLQLDNDGNFNWMHKLYAVELETEVDPDNELQINSQNQIIIAHDFVQYLNLDDAMPPILEATGDFQTFIMAFEQDGNVIWQHWLGGGGNSTVSNHRCLRIDDSDNIFIAGRYGSAEVEFNNNITGPEFFNEPLPSAHLVKFGPDGEFQWCTPLYSANFDIPIINRLEVAVNGDIVILGNNSTPIDIDPSENEWIISETGSFIVRFNPQLEPIYAFSITVSASVPTLCITGSSSDIQISGTSYYYDFAVGNNEYSFTDLLASVDATDILFLRISTCSASGCTDPEACNYDMTADCSTDTCTYPVATDTDQDCDVDMDDLANLLANFGCVNDCFAYDIDDDGLVTINDIVILIAYME